MHFVSRLYAGLAHDGVDVAGSATDQTLQRSVARRGWRRQQCACPDGKVSAHVSINQTTGWRHQRSETVPTLMHACMSMSDGDSKSGMCRVRSS